MKKAKVFLFGLLCFALIFSLVPVSSVLNSTPSSAEASASTLVVVTGKVTDEEGNPIPEVVLAFADRENHKLVATTFTDPEGNYFVNIPPGTYDSWVTPPAGSGFHDQTILGILIISDTTLDIVLAPAAQVCPAQEGVAQAPSQETLEPSRLSAGEVEGCGDPGLATGPPRFTVFATQLGNVGENTSNGHLIQEHDHFVALPSIKARCTDDKAPHEYEVRITYPKTGKSVVAPVWDVGPWNKHDDYWNPSSEREMWKDIPPGIPEAEAAYVNNYNGRFDETNLIETSTGTDEIDVGDRVRPTIDGLNVRSTAGGDTIGSVSTSDRGTVIAGPQKAILNGLYYRWWDITWDKGLAGWSAQKRYVSNPAGIDLADGTFLDDLGMTTNDWVTVEFLWMPAPTEDVTPPKLVEFDFTPKSIDTNSGPQSVTFSLRITDDLSGFDYAYLYIYSPSTQQYRNVYLSKYNRISGDAFDGTYQVSTEFPQYSEGGTWHIHYISLRDKVTNPRYLYEQNLINLGFPTEIEVIGIDIAPPQLKEFNFTSTSIDTSKNSQTVTFTLKITDDLSGFDYAYLYIYSPSTHQYRYVYLSKYNRISGDALDGTYQVSTEFPQYSEGGTWHIHYISLQDKVTNRRYLYEQDLINLGFPTEIEVISIPEDKDPPQLVNFDFSPKSIDTSDAPQDITFTLKITDDLSGFDYAYLYIYSPSTHQYRYIYLSKYNRISGDALDGTYQVSTEFPQYSEGGTWHIRYISLQDKVTNRRLSYEQDLINLGFPTEIENRWEAVNVEIFTDKDYYASEEDITISAKVTDITGNPLYPLKENYFGIFMDGAKVNIEDFKKASATDYKIKIKAPSTAGNYLITVKVTTKVGEGMDTQGIIVPQGKKALVIGITEFKHGTAGELDPISTHNVTQILEKLGFRVYEEIDYDTGDGDVITYDEVSTMVAHFKNSLGPNDVAVLYISTHGREISWKTQWKYEMFYGDDCYPEDPWFAYLPIHTENVRDQLKVIGANLDFLWLATCYSWGFDNEIKNLGAGGIIFFGNDGVGWQGDQDSVVFYESIVGGCYKCDVKKDKIPEIQSNLGIKSVEIIREYEDTAHVKICSKQQRYVEDVINDLNIPGGKDKYGNDVVFNLKMDDRYPSLQDPSGKMDLLDPLLTPKSPDVYMPESDEETTKTPNETFASVDYTTWDSDDDGLDDVATVSWDANTVLEEESITVFADVYDSAHEIVKSYIYGPYTIYGDSPEISSVNFYSTNTDTYFVRLTLYDSSMNATVLAFITDLSLNAGAGGPGGEEEFTDTWFDTIDSNGDGVGDTIKVSWNVDTTLPEENVSVLVLVCDKVFKYGPYTIYTSQSNEGEIEFYVGDVGTYEISLYLVDSNSELEDVEYLEVPLETTTLTDSYADYGVDTDGDGKYNQLVIDIGINVCADANYTLRGSLFDKNGNLILTATTSTYLTEGEKIVPLSFDGQTIYKNGIEGPYELRYLKLYKGGVFDSIGHRDRPYTTSAYDYTEFQPPLVVLDWNLITPPEVILDETFNITVGVTNPSNRTLTKLQASLSLPSEFDTTESLIIEVGNLEPGQTKEIDWTLKGINPGYGEIMVNITSPDIQSVSAIRGIIVAHFSLTENTNKDVYIQGDDVILITTLTNNNPEIFYIDLLVDVTVQGLGVKETHSIPINYVSSLETRNFALTWDTTGKINGTYTVTAEVLEDSMVLNETSTSFILGIIDTTLPLVTNPTATPLSIVADGIQESQLNVTVTDESGIASVTIDLSDIGGSPAQEMNNILSTDVYTVNTTAAVGTAPDTYELQVNTTDIYGNSNTSVSIALTVLVPATIDFDPDTLNKKSKGKWVTVYTELPAGYNVTDINVSTMMLNETVPAELQPIEVGDYDSDGILDLMVKFDRQVVTDILPIGDAVDIAVTGKLYNGASFEGSDTIRVLNEG